MADNSTISNDFNPTTRFFSCYHIHPYSIILPIIVFSIFLFLLPLYVFVIYHGLQQWMKKSSSSSSAAAMSHSDCFTYNMVLMELLAVVVHVFYYWGNAVHSEMAAGLGYQMVSAIKGGKMLLQLLTCVERYLAVVHPITYMRLKNRKGTRIRNATIVCVWLFGGAYLNIFAYLGFCVSALAIAAVCFCSVSVLVVLVRPGPGEQGGNKKWADPSKKRAFYTIVVILGVLVVRISGDLVWGILCQEFVPSICVNIVYIVCLGLPNSLLLPLLFFLKHGRSNRR